MNIRIFLSLSAALLFLSAGVLTYAQNKPATTVKNTKTTHIQQVTHTTKPVKTSSLKTKMNKEKPTKMKMTKSTTGVKVHKITKNESSKPVTTKEPMHHKKLGKKIQSKESKTPLKK